MNIFKDIKEIKSEIQHLKETMAGDFEKKSRKLDEIEYYLSKIQLNVKNVSEIIGPDGRTDIRVVYEVPQLFIMFDDSGEIIENETFKAINMLNLISSEDMIKILKAIENKKSLK